MGTRSQTRIQDTQGRVYVQIYRQMDGYPSGMGKDLADIMASRSLTNGIGGNKEVFNGAGCFAAYLVGALKGDRAGGIYLQPNTKDLFDYDYTYVITYPDEPTGAFAIDVHDYQGNKLFVGQLPEFAAFCASDN
jgi:hypothetical protein